MVGLVKWCWYCDRFGDEERKRTLGLGAHYSPRNSEMQLCKHGWRQKQTKQLVWLGVEYSGISGRLFLFEMVRGACCIWRLVRRLVLRHAATFNWSDSKLQGSDPGKGGVAAWGLGLVTGRPKEDWGRGDKVTCI